MRHTTRCFAVLCVLLAASALEGIAQKDGNGAEGRSALPTLAIAALRLEGKAQQQKLAVLSQERRDLQQALTAELDKAIQPQQKAAVIYLMGLYRAEECTRWLAQNVALRDESRNVADRKPLWGDYPAVEALVSIGKPSVSYMLRNIETGKEDEFRRLSTEVIRKIEGPEAARFVLELKIKKAKDEAGRRRLEGALEYLEKVKN